MTDTDTETDTSTTATDRNSTESKQTGAEQPETDDRDARETAAESEDDETAHEEREWETETILVSSIESGIGKTAITIALAGIARDGGARVGYMKPKGTRLESNVGKTLDADPLLAREILGLDAELHDLEPVVYSPTFIEQTLRGREDPDEIHERVEAAFETVAEGCDRLFVEGGGEYTVGGIVDLTDPDVANRFDAEVILVAPYSIPRDVDDVLAAAAAFGDRLAGVVFNNVENAAHDTLESTVVPFLESRGIPVFGILPRIQTLSGVSVDELASELGASVLVEGEDSYIERFSVGAMGADSALRYFRRTKDAAVITGGDRAGIHTAALEAPGVTCLILTGGQQPSKTIIGEAAQQGLSILSVQTDTLTTVERAENIVRSGRTRDESTVDRMEDLLSDHVDVESILEGISGA
ncbi:hypothetical protein SAMN04487967_0189 [Natronorubrum sediminis]|uniref:DRTGG domain-containing protein n=1 Tax=Natronorubrum sediminis TaxID=640943 RepID=A0A1H6FLV6_9EURY|nr:phosphotransacetylase family protein [Natronorubrum sediminis]SEH11088.1 hypothetical protein SAMN04487967_0189 [Natronorubrum sediminis]